MNTYTVGQFQDFARTINCMEYEEFYQMYISIGFQGEHYIQEKYQKKNHDFLTWLCELSPAYLNKMMEYCGF